MTQIESQDQSSSYALLYGMSEARLRFLFGAVYSLISGGALTLRPDAPRHCREKFERAAAAIAVVQAHMQNAGPLTEHVGEAAESLGLETAFHRMVVEMEELASCASVTSDGRPPARFVDMVNAGLPRVWVEREHG